MLQTLLEHPWSVWILLAIVAGLLEVLLPYFTFSFVGLAAVVAAVSAAWLGWEIQVVIFCITLLASVVILRPVLIRKFHVAHHIPSRSQILMGLGGEVTEEIDAARNTGRVSVQGEDWSARSEQVIRVGIKVEVVGHDGIVLIVREISG